MIFTESILFSFFSSLRLIERSKSCIDRDLGRTIFWKSSCVFSVIILILLMSWMVSIIVRLIPYSSMFSEGSIWMKLWLGNRFCRSGINLIGRLSFGRRGFPKIRMFMDLIEVSIDLV